jgi:hypothetical protein
MSSKTAAGRWSLGNRHASPLSLWRIERAEPTRKKFYLQCIRRRQREEEKLSERKKNLTADAGAAVKRSGGALPSVHRLSRSGSAWSRLSSGFQMC